MTPAACPYTPQTTALTASEAPTKNADSHAASRQWISWAFLLNPYRSSSSNPTTYALNAIQAHVGTSRCGMVGSGRAASKRAGRSGVHASPGFIGNPDGPPAAG